MNTHNEITGKLQKLARRIHLGFPEITEAEALSELYLWLQETTRISRLHWKVDPQPLTATQREDLDSFVSRRSIGLPFAYILGRVEFFGLELMIGPGVLIPRPETEELVELSLSLVREKQNPSRQMRILDLCCGSGCIGVALSHALTQNHDSPRGQPRRPPLVQDLFIAYSDISGYALEYARSNALCHSSPGVQFETYEGDLLEPIREAGLEPFDIIVANPPYIHPDEIEQMSRETYLHEPSEALFHEEPVQFYMKILRDMQPFLRPAGFAVLELSPFIGTQILEQSRSGFPEYNVELRKDLAGKDRFLIFACKG